MAPKQKMRIANEKHSKNVTNRGNVPKTLVSLNFFMYVNKFATHTQSQLNLILIKLGDLVK